MSATGDVELPDVGLLRVQGGTPHPSGSLVDLVPVVIVPAMLMVRAPPGNAASLIETVGMEIDEPPPGATEVYPEPFQYLIVPEVEAVGVRLLIPLSAATLSE